MRDHWRNRGNSFVICTLPFVGFYIGTYTHPDTWEDTASITDSIKEAIEKCSFKSYKDAEKLKDYLNENIHEYNFGVIGVNEQYDFDEKSDRKLYISF